MVNLIKNADVLIMDAQYDAEEYASRVGWGHGCVDDTVAIQKDGAAQGMGDTVHSNYDTAAGAVVKTKRR